MPKPSDARLWGGAIGLGITQALAGASAGAIGYQTQAAMNADLNHAAGTMGNVFADPTAANDGIYIKQGASGAGSWTHVSLSTYGLAPNVTVGSTVQLAAGQLPYV